MKYFYVIADVNKKTTKSRIPQLLHNAPGLKHDPVMMGCIKFLKGSNFWHSGFWHYTI